MVAFNRFRKKGKAKAKAKKVVRAPRMTFAQKVNQIIARNVENKYTDTKQTTLPVLTVVGDVASPYNNTFNYLNWSPGSITVGIFDISQGVAINERVGNDIKIKKWILKGMVQPDPSFVGVAPTDRPTTGLKNTQTGYIDIYFGKLLNNLSPPPAQLTNFYQNGAVDISPTSRNQELLYRINKDLYKIYYHKRFKMGTGNGGTTVSNLQFPQSNDFQMTRSFGFDITKYILKNKLLKYDEIVPFPQNPDIQNLTIWAVWHPVVGEVIQNNLPISGDTVKSFYQINLVSYAEYEDA